MTICLQFPYFVGTCLFHDRHIQFYTFARKCLSANMLSSFVENTLKGDTITVYSAAVAISKGYFKYRENICIFAKCWNLAGNFFLRSYIKFENTAISICRIIFLFKNLHKKYTLCIKSHKFAY